MPERVTAGLDTVGMRMPAHPVALHLIRAAGVPIAAPSANRFTEVSPTTAQHVRDSLGDSVDLIVDAGPTDVGIESTVLSLVSDPLLLRPGMVTREEIEAIIGRVRIAGAVDGAHPSPGLHRRHYSPRTPVIFGTPPPDRRAAAIWWRNKPDCTHAVQMPADAKEYARCLYDVLRRLDTGGWDVIAVEPVPDDDAWAGVRDRLMRAASED